MVSTAGAKQYLCCWKQGSGWVYQAGTLVTSSTYSPASSVEAEPQVWDCSGTGCTMIWSKTQNFGTLSSINNEEEFIYFSSSSVITFEYDVHYTSGTIQVYTYTFNLSTYSDPDNSFQVGVVSASGSCGSCIEMHLQAGLESPTTQSGWNVNYNVSPNYLWWYNSGTLTSWAASGISAYAVQGSGAYITDSGSTGGTIYYVGGTNYSCANAFYYNAYGSSYPAGVVDWYYSGTCSTISTGTSLW